MITVEKGPTPRTPLAIIVLCYGDSALLVIFATRIVFSPLNMNANAGVRGSTVVAVLLTLLGVQVKRQRFKIPPWFIRYCSFVLVNNLLSHANYTTELVNNKTT